MNHCINSITNKNDKNSKMMKKDKNGILAITSKQIFATAVFIVIYNCIPNALQLTIKIKSQKRIGSVAI